MVVQVLSSLFLAGIASGCSKICDLSDVDYKL